MVTEYNCFNLVDGVVDEFHDESGTDEGEGSNDNYCVSNDNYINIATGRFYSAGFSISAKNRDSDTSTTVINPAQNGLGEGGTFTVV